MKKLLRLQKGDTIAIINPAFRNPDNVYEKYQKMIEYIKGQGYNIVFGKSFINQFGYLAGTDEQRANDVNEMFSRKDIKAIVCMRGGYGASRIVDKVDYKLIKKNPKIFCGFSDITVLLNAIYQKAHIPTIHGLVSLFFGGKSCDEFSYNNFWETLCEKQLGKELKNPNDKCQTLIPGKAEGVLVGGNLSLIATLVGTEYEVDFTNKIVFIEEVTEEPYQIDRYLSSIRLSGMLSKAKGFVFGYFSECEPSENRVGTQSYLDIIKDYVGKLGKPVIYDFACGHSFPFVSLPIGAKVLLDADEKKIIITEEIYE